MKKSSRTLLIFACIFITVALAFLCFESIFIGVSLEALYGGEKTLGDAIGGVLVYVYAILLAGGAIIFSLLTLPFEVPLFRLQGKKWYTIALLIAIFAIIVAAVCLVFILPTVQSMQPSSSSISSSSIQ